MLRLAGFEGIIRSLELLRLMGLSKFTGWCRVYKTCRVYKDELDIGALIIRIGF